MQTSKLPERISLTKLEAEIILDRLEIGDTIADSLLSAVEDYPYSLSQVEGVAIILAEQVKEDGVLLPRALASDLTAKGVGEPERIVQDVVRNAVLGCTLHWRAEEDVEYGTVSRQKASAIWAGYERLLAKVEQELPALN